MNVCPDPACSQDEPWGLTPEQGAAIEAARAELEVLAKAWAKKHAAALSLAFGDEKYGGFDETYGHWSLDSLVSEHSMGLGNVLYDRKRAYRMHRLRGVTKHRTHRHQAHTRREQWWAAGAAGREALGVREAFAQLGLSTDASPQQVKAAFHKR
jgi:hypothetical protein